MRRVEIIEESRNQRPWVAIDANTRQPILRMQRLETLLTISRSLDWEVVTETDRKLSVRVAA
jgi:hypothetical protein